MTIELSAVWSGMERPSESFIWLNIVFFRSNGKTFVYVHLIKLKEFCASLKMTKNAPHKEMNRHTPSTECGTVDRIKYNLYLEDASEYFPWLFCCPF